MFKIDVKVTSKGHDLSPRGLAQVIERETKRAASKQIQKRIESVVCPVHNQHAEVVKHSSYDGTIGETVKACCPELLEAVRKTLGQ